MRRLARRLFTLCSAASLLLCVAACAAWIRSYWIGDEVQYVLGSERPPRQVIYSVESGRGGVTVERFVWVSSRDNHDEGWHWRRTEPRYAGKFGATDPRWLGFDATVHHYQRAQAVSRSFVMPYWFVVCLTMLAPALALRTLARRPNAKGLCPRCGYDLRASPERCPECGTAPQVTT